MGLSAPIQDNASPSEPFRTIIFFGHIILSILASFREHQAFFRSYPDLSAIFDFFGPTDGTCASGRSKEIKVNQGESREKTGATFPLHNNCPANCGNCKRGYSGSVNDHEIAVWLRKRSRQAP